MNLVTSKDRVDTVYIHYSRVVATGTPTMINCSDDDWLNNRAFIEPVECKSCLEEREAVTWWAALVTLRLSGPSDLILT